MLKLLPFIFLYGCVEASEVINIPHDKELGGLSGLAFYQGKLYSLTDRGPNSEKEDVNKDGIDDRVFQTPDYNPKVVILNETFDKIAKTIPLTHKGNKLTGLGNQGHAKNPQSYDEAPFDKNKKPLSFDPLGIDPEGITIDEDGHIWICEEYGPSLLKFNSQGELQARYIPKKSKREGEEVLPSFLNQRKLNRGFEGITFAAGKVYFILQSPIPNIKEKKSFKRTNHIFSLDPKTKKLDHFIYKMHKKGKKIGAITHLSGLDFLVLEQNGKVGPDSWQRIYKVELNKGIEFKDNMLSEKTKSLPHLDKKEFLKLELSQIEKLEGMQVVGKYLFIIEDNDFGLRDDEKQSTSRLIKFKLP